MKSGVDRRPKLLCANCPRFVGMDEEVVVCSYCMAPLKRRGVSPIELCRRNRDAHTALCRVRGRRIATLIWSLVLGFIFIRVLHNSIADVFAGTVIISVWFAFGWYIRNRVKPRFPDIFASEIWKYGVPEDPPEKQFRPIL